MGGLSNFHVHFRRQVLLNFVILACKPLKLHMRFYTYLEEQKSVSLPLLFANFLVLVRGFFHCNQRFLVDELNNIFI